MEERAGAIRSGYRPEARAEYALEVEHPATAAPSEGAASVRAPDEGFPGSRRFPP